jgi:GGDEF domain-containing protein
MRLKSLLHEESGEFVARTGGDEFVAMYRIDETKVSRTSSRGSKPRHCSSRSTSTGFELLRGEPGHRDLA